MAIENFTSHGVLGLLERAPYTFHLGGSRAMEAKERRLHSNFDAYIRLGGEQFVYITPTTDYDFYATYSPELLDYLLTNGFSHTTSSIGGFLNNHHHYLDDEAVAIVELDNVQIVLRRDAEFYNRVFESIPVEFYAKYLWKSSPYGVDPSQIQPIFNALFAAAHATETK